MLTNIQHTNIFQTNSKAQRQKYAKKQLGFFDFLF